MQEIWKSLKGVVEYGDYYEVSNLGRVRSVDRKIICGKGKSLTDEEKDIVVELYVNKKSHTQSQLADMFGVSRATIQRAIKEG